MPVSTECTAALLSFRYPSIVVLYGERMETARTNKIIEGKWRQESFILCSHSSIDSLRCPFFVFLPSSLIPRLLTIRLPTYSGTPSNDHLVYATASLLRPYFFDPNVKITESFIIMKTPLMRPPWYYDQDFMAQRWSH